MGGTGLAAAPAGEGADAAAGALALAGAATADLPRGARVAVAMSGGVDSSVAAAVLAREGFEVVGITLRLHAGGGAAGGRGEGGRSCCAGRDVADARAVARRLGVAHYVLDFEERFRRAVIDDFADAYAAGRTPVPCARCNERVKFGDLLGIARDLGAAALATGHYARRTVRGRGAGPWLCRGREAARDQSYFLFATTREQLDFLRFPLGDLPKAATRALARALDLPVAGKPDSQDLCFVRPGAHAALVRSLRPEAGRPGEIVDPDGRPLGRHDGIAGFTPGQRRGLGVAAGRRLYVLAVDAASARVTVGPRDRDACAEVRLEGLNWLGEGPPGGDGLEARLRHNSPPAPTASVEPAAGGGARVRFAEPQAGAAPGQACVLYAGERVMGGGWIAAAPRVGPARPSP